MKYKVIFQITTSNSGRASANAEFYVHDEAVDACNQWIELGQAFYAYLWDGEIWRTFAPIP